MRQLALRPRPCPDIKAFWSIERDGQIEHFRNTHVEGEVHWLIVNLHGLIEFIETIVVQINTQVVITCGDRAVGNIALLIGNKDDHLVFTKFNIDELDFLVRNRITSHTRQGILKQ